MKTMKSWHNCLELNEWVCLHDVYRNKKLVFKLSSYEIINGTPKFTIEIQGGRQHTAGLNKMSIGDMTVRLFMPLELLKPLNFKYYSPKLLFTLPTEWMISKLSEVHQEKSSVYDKVRKHQSRKVNL